ncbi:NifU family protein [Amnibacterium endophyticum]|uniref:NifU family protein n=1 Tax=Amnibacterium endophyticum TaxID=2109337 RepID=A0ABW4LAN6_9MICO
MTAAVALHPEAVPGAPLEVRWIVPAGSLPFVGAPARVPEALATLLERGLLAEVVVEPAAVRTVLAAGREWRADGAVVRAGLETALADPDGWAPATGADAGDVLRAAVQEVLAGDVGAYIRSHGGALELVEVEDARVRVRFSGTCAHCPASDETLTDRFETAVRALAPALEAVDTDRVPAPRADGPRFLGIPVRRRR